MDYLWTPWRYQYMEQVTAGKQPDCIFCDAVALNKDDETLIAYRGAKTFVILNRFPYTSGHIMIVPYAHVAELSLCDADTLGEMMKLSQREEKAGPRSASCRGTIHRVLLRRPAVGRKLSAHFCAKLISLENRSHS